MTEDSKTPAEQQEEQHGFEVIEPGQDRHGARHKGVYLLPNLITTAALFAGFYAIVATTRGDFEWAAWFIVWAAVTDLLDGRIARFTRTGSKFGEELDSLVDAISFGVAPAFIMYTLYLSDDWNWVLPLVYVMAVVVRLALPRAPFPDARDHPCHVLPVQPDRLF